MATFSVSSPCGRPLRPRAMIVAESIRRAGRVDATGGNAGGVAQRRPRSMRAAHVRPDMSAEAAREQVGRSIVTSPLYFTSVAMCATLVAGAPG